MSFRPNIAPNRINVYAVMKEYGSFQAYMKGKKMLQNGHTPNITGLFFGGGPAPSANAVFKAIVTGAQGREDAFILAFEDGCEGLLSGDCVVLTPALVWGTQRDGGVLIGTARKNPNTEERTKIADMLRRAGIGSLIGVGGDDTQTTLIRLMQSGINVVGVPKTIDNDVPGTDKTFGADTVVDATAKELFALIDDRSVTGTSILAKIMGRSSGYWTLNAGKAAQVTRTFLREEFTKKGIGEIAEAEKEHPFLRKALENIADVVRIKGAKPASVEDMLDRLKDVEDERLITVDTQAFSEQIRDLVARRKAVGIKYVSIAMAEGIVDKLNVDVTDITSEGRPAKGVVPDLGIEVKYDEHGNPRLSDIEYHKELIRRVALLNGNIKILSFDLGYQFRCVNPIATDINLGQDYGDKAYELVSKGQFGNMVRLRDNQIGSVPFDVLPWDEKTKHLVPRVVSLDSSSYIAAKRMELSKESPKLYLSGQDG